MDMSMNITDTNNAINIHESYSWIFMKVIHEYSWIFNEKTWYRIMFGLVKKIFIGLLTRLVNGSNHTKCVWLGNRKCMTFINLHPNECSQEFHYYPLGVELDRCVGSCNTLNDLSNKVCVPNKTEDLSIRVFNIFTGINEWKTLTKHISCARMCKFNGRKCKSDQWWNSDKCRCEFKKWHLCEKDYFWNPSSCNCENGKYLASIMDDSGIICDEVIYPNSKSNDETLSKEQNKF